MTASLLLTIKRSARGRRIDWTVNDLSRHSTACMSEML